MRSTEPGSSGHAPRVALLLHELSLTGAPRLALGLFEGVGGEVELRMVAATGGPLAGEFRKLAPLAVLSGPRVGRGDRRSGYARKGLAVVQDSIAATRTRIAFGKWRPDVVYVNSVQALPLVDRLGLSGVPAILHVHEGAVALANYEAAHPGLIRRVPRSYIAVSAGVGEELADRYGIDRGRIAFARPFVHVGAATTPPRADRVHGDGRFIVGGIGNPSWYKGLVLWLLAARDVVDALGADRVRFVWVGTRDNDEGRYFAAMTAKLRLESSVELVPETGDVAEELARFDVLAMSSWEEAASLAVLESMARGLPVVAFAGSGGPAEEIGEAGVITEDFSPAAMAWVLIDLARRPERRAELGSAGRERVQSNYSREAAVAVVRNAIMAAVRGT